MQRVLRNAVVGLAVALLTSSVSAAQSNWTRYYVGGTPLSLESPRALGAAATAVVDDPKDWVAKTVQYLVETKSYVLQVTLFEGKEGQVANLRRLASTMADFVSTIADEAYTTRFTPSADEQSGRVDFVPIEGKKSSAAFRMISSDVGALDGQPVLKVDIERSEAKGKILFRIALVGEGKNVHLVAGIGFPVDPEGARIVDRVMQSIRFRKGI